MQEVAATIQASAHAQISKVVTRCLKAVFGEEAYEFKIDFKQARGKTEARLLFIREGQEIDPIDAAGGGVLDVASLALRLSCLMLARPRRRKLLCLDEPCKYLSTDYRPAVRKLILILAKETGIQFILVTHSEALKMGTIIEIGD